MVREVADALSGVHSLGLYHQRINPDTVILTPDGHVKIVGLLIEAGAAAAARHRPGSATTRPTARPPPRTSTSRISVGCSTPAWCRAGPADRPSACRPRPSTGRHWLSPRQVRAGVSPALDNVCDQILGDPPRRRAPAAADRQRRGQRAHRRARPRRRLRRTSSGGCGNRSPGDHHPAAAPLRPGLGRHGPARPSGPRWRRPVGRRHGWARAIPSAPPSPPTTSTRVTVIRQPPPPVPTKRSGQDARPPSSPALDRHRGVDGPAADRHRHRLGGGAPATRHQRHAHRGVDGSSAPPVSSASPVEPRRPHRMGSRRRASSTRRVTRRTRRTPTRSGTRSTASRRPAGGRSDYNNDPELGGIKRGRRSGPRPRLTPTGQDGPGPAQRQRHRPAGAGPEDRSGRHHQTADEHRRPVAYREQAVAGRRYGNASTWRSRRRPGSCWCT